MVAQVSQMQNNKDAHPYPLQRKTLNESTPWFSMTHRWRHEVAHHIPISHGSTHVIIQETIHWRAEMQRFDNLPNTAELLS
jgi:hypothetical protein